MNYKDLELNISQVEHAIKNCRKKFKSERKQKIYNNLIRLFESVKKSDYKSFDITRLRFSRNSILHFVYIGVEFLNYKKYEDTPHRLIKCLELVLEDWLDNPALFAVVFSHNNSLREFYTFAVDESDLIAINRVCRRDFGVEYDYSLIHISQPRFFKNDYLSSIPMYHELGHFVEANYSIATAVVRDRTFKPHIVNKSERLQLISYVSEHFCDLFAAQYIGEAMCTALNYYAYKDPAGSEHPSTDERISVMKTFLSGSGPADDMDIVNRLKIATQNQTLRKRTSRTLEVRMVPLSEDPFVVDGPTKLSDSKQIHSLYTKAWEKFMSNSPEFEKKYPLPIDRLDRINFLIEKTIDLTTRKNSWATSLCSHFSK